MDIDKYMTVTASAKEADVSPQRIRQLLATGQLEGQKLGHSWLVSRSSIEAYKTQHKTHRIYR